jgi:peptidoglycan/xylan/chitin deacetylase (PgdA/CDA1 family)
MAFVRIPGILKKLYPGLTWSIRGEDSVLYLTFDDGPTPGITGQVLEMLAASHAKATFFCIGRNAERHPEILKKIIGGGHAVGNHTYSHLKGWYTPDREYYADIELASRFVPSSLYRPAYGMITPAQIGYLKKKFRIVLWEVMSYDFDAATSKEKCLSNVIRNAGPGSVIVFHDSVKASASLLYALPRVLDYLRRLKNNISLISLISQINYVCGAFFLADFRRFRRFL